MTCITVIGCAPHRLSFPSNYTNTTVYFGTFLRQKVVVVVVVGGFVVVVSPLVNIRGDRSHVMEKKKKIICFITVLGYFSVNELVDHTSFQI